MHNLRKYVALGLLAALVTCAVISPGRAQEPSALDRIVRRGTVVIGIDLGAPPYGYLNEKRKPTGSDVATARMLAKDLGVTLKIEPITSENRVPYLLSNRVDLVMATFSITPERAKSITFSTPYGTNNSVIFAAKATAIKSATDLVGKSVAVARGTGNESLLLKAAPKGVRIVQFDNEASALAALAAGQVDAYCSDESIARSLNARFPGKFESKFFVENGGDFYGIGMKHGEPDLLRWVDTFVFFHRVNGDLARIYQEYVGAPLGHIPSL